MSAQHQFNPTEFPQEVIERLAFVIAGQIQKGDELLTKQEAADFLKVKYRTFERRISAGHYPTTIIHRDGGTLLFVKSEILKYVKSL
jgi:excisionase family DNA binding protein